MRRILFFFILTNVLSCGPTDVVKFEVSQPESVRPLEEFSKGILGQYIMNGNPEKLLIIENRQITVKSTYSLKFKRTDIELDSGVTFDIGNDRELINYLSKDGGYAAIKNDSVYYVMVQVDTFFSINQDNILKKYKGSYFLNFKFSDDYWKVKKMDLMKDTLTIGEIIPGDTLLRFEYATEVTESSEIDSVEAEFKEYVLTPSKREFKKLIRSDAFKTFEKYIRTKKGKNESKQ